MSLPAYEKLGTFYLGRVVDDDGKDTNEPMLYDSRDLTTHAVCVGMTGSGKTGLCLSLLEEAAIDGIPVLAIDPKGDIANLALQFPQLRPEDFLPWVDAGEAKRKGQALEEFSAATAASWKSGLAEWAQDGERIQRLSDAAEVVIYTPGSLSGRGLSVLRSFAAPDESLRSDASALKEKIAGAVSGLLSLLGMDADPLKSREHILLSTVLDFAWCKGEDLDLPTLIQKIQKPSFDKVGVFDLETFFPAKERLGLAMAMNNLLAAPGFAAWLEGDALDIQSLLYTPTGKPRIAIISIAHLSDAERMFIVTLLLNEVVAWMRRQSGTSALRALLYMDEIFGYFPPSATPPSKLPLLTLMKQARAFGLGVVLATQNPVDLDYKGLANAGTWFIGRLQTERDKARVIEGLLGSGGEGMDKQRIEGMIANLSQRVFLMRNVHEAVPVLVRSRWVLSYLRGPMTLLEIQRLKQPSSSPVVDNVLTKPITNPLSMKPMLPVGVNEYYLHVPGRSTYVPMVLGVAKIHFVDSKAGVDEWQNRTFLASLTEDGTGPDWFAAKQLTGGKQLLDNQVSKQATYGELPAALLRVQNYANWSKALVSAIYQDVTYSVFSCAALKLSSNPDESEAEFRARIGVQLREQRDAEVDRLRKKFAPRLQMLQDQQSRAQQKIDQQQAQLSQQKLNAALTIGATLLGAFFGRKSSGAATLGKVATAARSATRVSRERQDVDQATLTQATIAQRLADLQIELEQEIAKIQGELDPAAIALITQAVKPRKTDTVVSEVALVWQAV